MPRPGENIWVHVLVGFPDSLPRMIKTIDCDRVRRLFYVISGVKLIKVRSGDRGVQAFQSTALDNAHLVVPGDSQRNEIELRQTVIFSFG